jgi:hypothetical protein
MSIEIKTLLLPGIMFIYGIFYLVFALKDPPDNFRRMFKIPFIFAIIPGRFGRFLGRFFSGILLIAIGYWIYYFMPQ